VVIAVRLSSGGLFQNTVDSSFKANNPKSRGSFSMVLQYEARAESIAKDNMVTLQRHLHELSEVNCRLAIQNSGASRAASTSFKTSA
jgi:hypothetical protein